MNRPSRSLVVLACIALAIGLIEPSLEIAWKCRDGFETSEACVWGKSFLPLGRAVGIVLIAPAAFAVMLVIRWMWRSRADGSSP
jgi:hypothetical protein